VWAFSLLLVVVGFLQVWLLLGTLRAIQRQAQQMEQQTTKLGESIEVSRNAAIAAQKSAEATDKAIELNVNEKRARIFVEVKELNLEEQKTLGPAVAYDVIFHGSTFAFIEETCAEVEITQSPEPPDMRSSLFLSVSIPKIIPPGTNPEACYSPIFQHIDQYEIEHINHQRSFVHFRGRIAYKDFVGRDRETTFCYTWRPAPPRPALGFPHWEKTGPPEANRET
jgi:hypothetical protein